MYRGLVSEVANIQSRRQNEAETYMLKQLLVARSITTSYSTDEAAPFFRTCACVSVSVSICQACVKGT